MEAFIAIGAVALLVLLVVATERARPRGPLSPGEEEAKARSTGDESMNDL